MTATVADPALYAHRWRSLALIAYCQVAALALFLCSGAARSITGSALSIDGGWTAR